MLPMSQFLSDFLDGCNAYVGLDILRTIDIVLCLYSAFMTIMGMYCFYRKDKLDRSIPWIRRNPQIATRLYIQVGALLALYASCLVELYTRFNMSLSWRGPGYLCIFLLFSYAQKQWYAERRGERVKLQAVLMRAQEAALEVSGAPDDRHPDDEYSDDPFEIEFTREARKTGFE